MQMLPLTKSAQLHHTPNNDRFFVQLEPNAKDEPFSTVQSMLSSTCVPIFSNTKSIKEINKSNATYIPCVVMINSNKSTEKRNENKYQ